jgi:hypothetical protein
MCNPSAAPKGDGAPDQIPNSKAAVAAGRRALAGYLDSDGYLPVFEITRAVEAVLRAARQCNHALGEQPEPSSLRGSRHG